MSSAKLAAANYDCMLNLLYKVESRWVHIPARFSSEGSAEALGSLNMLIAQIEELQYEAAMTAENEQEMKEWAEFQRLKNKFEYADTVLAKQTETR